MQTVFHPSDERGHADHGWLKTYHSFSFADFYDPERLNFGALRVLNDDTVYPGKGFRKHPHSNMEIVSIPLQGALEHEDSMGNKQVIREGEVQAMSAGTGVEHSEQNHSKEEHVKFLQIWLFPKEKDVEPRYDQMPLVIQDRENQWQQVVSPFEKDEGVKINQDAWFYLSRLDKDKWLDYKLHNKEDGVYIFLLEGEIKVGDKTLTRRDAIGIWDTEEITVESKDESEILLIEVPMDFK